MLPPPAEDPFGVENRDLVMVHQIQSVGGVAAGQQLGGVSDVRFGGIWGCRELRSPVAFLGLGSQRYVEPERPFQVGQIVSVVRR